MADKLTMDKSPSTKRIELDFHHQVSRDDLIHSLDKILGMAGCAACGIQGLDISFKNNLRLKELLEIPNVIGARIVDGNG